MLASHLQKLLLKANARDRLRQRTTLHNDIPEAEALHQETTETAPEKAFDSLKDLRSVIGTSHTSASTNMFSAWIAAGVPC